ncbi:MAG TPA: molybdopterin cofactor-binding domain-containing protein [Polyangiales bacterium]|nr:molybdopterin cofactor-binding domain-containing protein [Polyangiales bacterium]
MSASAPLPPSLQSNPKLDAWIRIDVGGTITLRTGKVELGQGIKTALALIAAEELDVELARIRVETADSARAPIEFMTVGSMSIESSGTAVRHAAALARRLLLARAAERLGVSADELDVRDGHVHARTTGASTSYWELQAGTAFEHDITALAELKPSSEYRQVGKPAQRVDLPGIAFGSQRFVQDLAPDGVVHARVVRPPSPRARLRDVELESARALPGVLAVVRDGSFLGVIAQREEQAVHAAAVLRAHADFELSALPDQGALHERLPNDLVGSFPLVGGVPVAAPVPPLLAPEGAAHTLRASYRRPYLMHASIGPSAALACFREDMLEIWSASQGVSLLAAAISQVLALPPERVRVVHVEGPGCYGHNGTDDAALDAALLARALPCTPVLLKWTRQDEHALEPYGPATRVDVQASLDAAGRLLAYNHDVYSYPHIGRAFPMGKVSALIAAQQLEKPFGIPRPRPMLAPQAGVHRNADPIYAIPAQRVVKHLCANSPFRTSSLRSLGAFANVFAIESMMDELAAAAGQDPIAFRLAHLNDERARAVIEAAAARAAELAPAPSGDPQRPRGRGMAFSRYENHKCYAAVFVALEVDLASHAIRLLQTVIAADAGLIVDPDGLANQLEGGFVQAASFTLKEEVHWNDQGISSLDWDSYPILGFEEVPAIEVVLLDRPDRNSRGAGEATTGPTPAAIANAVFDACGVRLRSTPFTPARLRAALFE